VVIDAGLRSPGRETAAIARHCDGVLVVVGCGTGLSALNKFARRLELFGLSPSATSSPENELRAGARFEFG